MEEPIRRHHIGVYTHSGGYRKETKECTETQLDDYYEELISEGHKVIGIISEDI